MCWCVCFLCSFSCVSYKLPIAVWWTISFFFSLCLVFYFVGGSHFVVVRKQKETATFFVLLFHTGSSIKFGRSSENDSKLLFVDLSAFQQQQQQFYRTTIFKACSFRMAVSPMNRFMFITPAKVWILYGNYERGHNVWNLYSAQFTHTQMNDKMKTCAYILAYMICER